MWKQINMKPNTGSKRLPKSPVLVHDLDRHELEGDASQQYMIVFI